MFCESRSQHLTKYGVFKARVLSHKLSKSQILSFCIDTKQRQLGNLSSDTTRIKNYSKDVAIGAALVLLILISMSSSDAKWNSSYSLHIIIYSVGSSPLWFSHRGDGGTLFSHEYLFPIFLIWYAPLAGSISAFCSPLIKQSLKTVAHAT